MNKKIILSLAIFGVLASCESTESITEKEGEVKSSLAAADQSPEELERELKQMKKDEENRVLAEKANRTTATFDKLKHDFGDVLPDSDNTTLFTITNTGDKPLIVEDVKASCGCTTPVKPTAPIAPGESDVIEVTFHPKPNQKNEITKTVTVTANTAEKVQILEIRAFVK